jgi:histidyl-tRNA synthetase
MALQFKTPRGTKDIFPPEIYRWHYVEQRLRDLFSRYGFHEIRTPVFEETELFARGIGQSTDIVQKEMYTFVDKGGKSFTLRPEMTAPVMRAYLQHHLGEKRRVQKLYYIAPMFRQERPQAGRLRQFHQYGAEIIGTPDPLADAEIVRVAVRFLEELGVADFRLKLNSVGCPVCRPTYRDNLRRQLKPVLDQLCSDCQKRYDLNPLRILDCKRESCRELTAGVDSIEAFLCEDCAEHFRQVQELLASQSIVFEKDKRLVRGLDYYTRTAFEIVTSHLGAQDAICGGGRYDLLAAEFGENPVPGVGFAAGIERLLAVLEKQALLPEPAERTAVYLIGLGEAARRRIFALAGDLRTRGIAAELDYLGRSLKAQMRDANKLMATWTVILGENELEREVAILKNMLTGEQEEVQLSEIQKILEARLR